MAFGAFSRLMFPLHGCKFHHGFPSVCLKRRLSVRSWRVKVENKGGFDKNRKAVSELENFRPFVGNKVGCVTGEQGARDVWNSVDDHFLRVFRKSQFRGLGKRVTVVEAVNGDAREHGAEGDGSGGREGGEEGKSKIVFLGTPEVAAGVLEMLFEASQKHGSLFEVCAVVTQPPSSRGRGRRKDKPSPSPVAQLAIDKSFPTYKILSPESAREEQFLEELRRIGPDLCVTAAYGNFLPPSFLSIPSRGTVNIHPSLLPLYRGASPVQRAIQEGASVTGVTVAFTVRAMDAGPIIASHTVAVHPDIKAPELLRDLFDIGTNLFLDHLPSILDGSAETNAKEQNHSMATHAPKVSAEEGVLVFSHTAERLHNTVRAFAGWPGTRTTFFSENPNSKSTSSEKSNPGRVTESAKQAQGQESSNLDTSVSENSDCGTCHSDALDSENPISRTSDSKNLVSGNSNLEASKTMEEMEVKIITARWKYSSQSDNKTVFEKKLIEFENDTLQIYCDDGSVLEVLELQPISKKVMGAKAFWNGLRGRKLYRK